MKVCFVGPHNYPVLNTNYPTTYIGGESVQQTLLAKALVERGHDVSMICYDYGQEDDEVIDGVRVIRWIRPRGGLPGIRFIHPRLTTFLAKLKKADAEVYYQSCANVLTGFTAFFCRRKGRKFVFRVAHDADCSPDNLLLPYWRDRKIYLYGLRRADLVLAQGERQARMLQENFGLPSKIMNMMVELPSEAGATKDIDVLWVNNFRRFKCPEKFIDLAKMMPDLKMTMVGGTGVATQDYFNEVAARAEGVGNIELTGLVPYSKVNAYFERARVFVNTSDSEGFPNSFLQAWIRGVPVISFFDPDGLIAKHDLGAVPSSLEDMAVQVRTLLERPDLPELSERVRAFAMERYSPAAVAALYEQHLCDWEGER